MCLKACRHNRIKPVNSVQKNKIPGMIFLLLCLLIPVLKAQESLILKQVWDMALQNNLTLRQQTKSLIQADQEIYIQNTALLPSLSLTSYYQYQSELARLELPFMPGTAIQAGFHNQYDVAAVIQQPVFKGFRTLYSVRAAREKYELQTLQQTMQQNLLLLQSAEIFFNLQLNLLQQKVLRESIDRTSLQLERLQNLLAAQQISGFDTLEIANHKLDQLNRLQVTEDQNKILQSKLENLLNVTSLPVIDRPITINDNFTLKPLTEYQQVALEKRAELARISAANRLQSTMTNIIKAGYYPQVYARFAYHYARPGVNYFNDEWMKYYTLNLSLQWELWNWRRDANKVQQANIEQQKLDLEQQKIVQDIQQQVKEVYLYLQSLVQQIRLQKRLVEQENERYRITQEKFQQGIMTSLDLNTAEHALTEAQLRLEENHISWRKYRIQLDFVCGIIGISE